MILCRLCKLEMPEGQGYTHEVECPISLEQFENQLKHHDWYYQFSDDGRVWRAGDAEYSRLKSIALNKDDDYKRMFNKHHDAHFSPEKGFSTAKSPFTFAE